MASFDERRGDGLVVGDNASEYYLHCVEIADGSRMIEVGTVVTFTARPGLRGRDEASQVQVVGDVDSRT